MWAEVMLIAGVVSAAGAALLGASVVPHPYDKVVLGISAVAGAVCAYLKQSPMTPKE